MNPEQAWKAIPLDERMRITRSEKKSVFEEDKLEKEESDKERGVQFTTKTHTLGWLDWTRAFLTGKVSVVDTPVQIIQRESKEEHPSTSRYIHTQTHI